MWCSDIKSQRGARLDLKDTSRVRTAGATHHLLAAGWSTRDIAAARDASAG
jgi:hypothetical protein